MVPSERFAGFPDPLKTIAIFCFVVAISAGHASIPKLASLVPYPLGQARFAFALVAIICAALTGRRTYNALSVKLAALLAVLCTFLACHAAIFGESELAHVYVVDVMYLAVFGFLCADLMRDECDLWALCGSLIVIAVPLAPVWYFRNTATFTGFTTITYYRIEFFAYMGCIYFALKGWRIAWIGAAAFLFFTLDSTSKSAVFFAPISVLYMCFALAVRVPVLQRPFQRSAIVHLVFLAAVVSFFIPARSATVASRIQYVAVEKNATKADRNMDGVEMNNLFTFNDGTQRVRLALRAFEITGRHPLLGQGIGTYAIPLLNGDQNGFEVYRYPHDVSLEVLYSTGLLGFAIYGFCLVIFFVTLHRRMIENPDMAALGCGAFFAFITSHFSGDFYDMRMFWLLIIAAAGAYLRPVLPDHSVRA